MIPIEITEQQALAFRLLSELGAWDIINGSVTIHFDSQGFPSRGEKRQVIQQARLTSYVKRV